MKIKNLIVICVVLLVLIVGAITIISLNSREADEPELVDIEAEEDETIEVTIVNSTGKDIKTLYIFQDDNEEYIDEDGDQKWVELLDNKSIGKGDTEEAVIETNGGDGAWDFRIITDDGEYELNEVLGKDFVYNGATIEFVIKDGHLDVVDDGLTEEDVEEQEDEEDDEENQDNQENSEDEEDNNTEENPESEDSTGNEENTENNEE